MGNMQIRMLRGESGSSDVQSHKDTTATCMMYSVRFFIGPCTRYYANVVESEVQSVQPAHGVVESSTWQQAMQVRILLTLV